MFLYATRRPGLLVVFLALFIIAGVATGVFQARFDDFINPKRVTEWNNLTDREEIWQVVDRGIREEPWMGHGLGSVNRFVSMSPRRNNTLELGAHNDYRKFLFEGGIPAGLSYLAMWLALIVSAWRIRSLGANEQYCFYAGALVATLACGFMAIATLNELMADHATMALFWSLAGAALGVGHSARRAAKGV